jgi:acetolactate synthase-1/2/3 large subunit
MTIKNEEETNDAMEWLWKNPNEPALLQVHIDTFANAYPKIAFGNPITEMEPFGKSIQKTSPGE